MSHDPIDELAARRARTAPRTSIPSQSEYEMREAREYQRQIQEVDRAPLSERKEACAEFEDAMKKDPALVGERVGWVINGSYGYGSYQAAKRVVHAGGRTNKAAILTHMVAALEWRCPQKMAIAGWKKLTTEEKAALDRAVKAEIASAQKGEE